jgi:hypothetical protein
MEMVQLGDLGKCKITGFSGVVTVMSTWLNGCIRVGLQPQELKDGKPQETQHYDIGQVEVVTKGVLTPVILHPTPAPAITPEARRRTTGGPDREDGSFQR